MKISITIIFLIFSFVSSYGQHGVVPKIKKDTTISLPIFLDSLKLKEDILKFDDAKKIYSKLKKRNESSVFQYSFNIETNGRMIPLRKENVTLLKPLNLYVVKKFMKYKWKPAHKHNCQKCLVKALGVFQVIFDTSNEYIVWYLVVNRESSYKVFSFKQMMNKSFDK